MKICIINLKMGKFKLDSSKFKKVTKDMVKYIKKSLPKNTFNEFKKNTPVRSGNARNKTKLSYNPQGFSITGDYPYSEVLDKGLFPKTPAKGIGKTRNGYSTQAPEGMIKPTIKFIENKVKSKIRRK